MFAPKTGRQRRTVEHPDEPARWTVLLDCSTTARLEEGFALRIEHIPLPPTTIDVDFSTHYENIGMAGPLPRQLMAEVRVTGGTFPEAVAAAEQTVNNLSPLMSLACNVLVPEFQLKLAYETTAGATQRYFKQWFYDEPSSLLPLLPGRVLDAQGVFSVIDHVMQDSEGERIHRACVQYQEALRAWLPQRELRAVMHLFMAAEALTKPLLRHECKHRSLDETALCAEWGIEKARLDGEVRRRLIFHEDRDCYKTIKKVSDGVEHAFLGFREAHQLAAGCRDGAGLHIRRCILEFLHLAPETYERLTSSTYHRAVSGHGVNRSIEGIFTGSGELAAPGNRYPFFGWDRRIKAVTRRGNEYDMDIEENFPSHWAAGLQFSPTSHGASIPLPDASINVLKGTDNLTNTDKGRRGGFQGLLTRALEKLHIRAPRKQRERR
jgi:hypothetical protein